jgi:hypothetical protein
LKTLFSKSKTPRLRFKIPFSQNQKPHTWNQNLVLGAFKSCTSGKERIYTPHVKKNRSRAHEIFYEAKGYGKSMTLLVFHTPKEPPFFRIE